MRFILPPTEGIRNSSGKGVQEEAISKGVGSEILKVFFPGTLNETRIIVFIDDLTLTDIAECFFLSLPTYDNDSLHISNMNVISAHE